MDITSHITLNESVLDRLQSILSPLPTPYIRTDIESLVAAPPCDDCRLTGWCAALGEQCVAFNSYAKHGRYEDGDVGTIPTIAKRKA